MKKTIIAISILSLACAFDWVQFEKDVDEAIALMRENRVPKKEHLTADDVIDLIKMELSVTDPREVKGSDIRVRMKWEEQQKRIKEWIDSYEEGLK